MPIAEQTNSGARCTMGGKAFFPSSKTKARRIMAEQAKQPQQPQQATKPQAAPPQKQVNLDNVLDSLFDTLPMVVDDDSGTINIKAKDFGLMALSLMGLGDIDIFTTFLRRRQQNAKFNQPIEYQQTQD